jgi:hypothetical protein
VAGPGLVLVIGSFLEGMMDIIDLMDQEAVAVGAGELPGEMMAEVVVREWATHSNRILRSGGALAKTGF